MRMPWVILEYFNSNFRLEYWLTLVTARQLHSGTRHSECVMFHSCELSSTWETDDYLCGQVIMKSLNTPECLAYHRECLTWAGQSISEYLYIIMPPFNWPLISIICAGYFVAKRRIFLLIFRLYALVRSDRLLAFRSLYVILLALYLEFWRGGRPIRHCGK